MGCVGLLGMQIACLLCLCKIDTHSLKVQLDGLFSSDPVNTWIIASNTPKSNKSPLPLTPSLGHFDTLMIYRELVDDSNDSCFIL